LDTPSPGDLPATEETGLVEELQQALAEKTEKLIELNDKYLRLAAEFDNYKRLAQRDQRDLIRFGNEQLLKELLPVVDNLERAIKASQNAVGARRPYPGRGPHSQAKWRSLNEISCHTRRDGRASRSIPPRIKPSAPSRPKRFRSSM